MKDALDAIRDFGQIADRLNSVKNAISGAEGSGDGAASIAGSLGIDLDETMIDTDQLSPTREQAAEVYSLKVAQLAQKLASRLQNYVTGGLS